MKLRSGFLKHAALLSVCATSALTQNAPHNTARQFAVTLQPGVPLRAYLTKRLTKRAGDPVFAKLVEPLYAVDREVAPAGADLIGKVVRLDPVPKGQRAAALLGGDFTPLHRAEVQFTEIVLPGGRRIAVDTLETEGLHSIYSPARPGKKPKKAAPPNGGILGTGKQQVKAQIQSQISGRTRGVLDVVRGPDKIERLEDLLVGKLPYHPQWIRKGTRFDAELRQPLLFGEASVRSEDLVLLGTQPPPDSVVHARMVTPINSKTSKLGEKVEAIVSRPLLSSDKKLILPEGTHLSGALTSAQGARWFHRGGHLRFNFDKIDLPPQLTGNAAAPTMRTAAVLDGAESSGKASIVVDQEGSAKTVEPKTRLLNTAIAVLIAAKTNDNDSERNGGVGEANGGPRTLGGLSGFGLAGSVAARLSRNAGVALGFYGMAGSIFTNIIARGVELEFAKNSAIDIRFGARR